MNLRYVLVAGPRGYRPPAGRRVSLCQARQNSLAFRGDDWHTQWRMRVVFDTSVLVAAARSRDGASFALISSIPSPRFQICLSIGLYTEWQDVLARPEHLPAGQTPADALRFLRFLVGHAWLQDIFFLWRPFLPDPSDDMVLELAFAAGCRYVVTHNVRDFRGCEQLGVEVVTPRDFLAIATRTLTP